MTKVSIIVPVYNVEKYLEQTINSIMNLNLQCIDCSIVKIILLNDKRIKGFFRK